MAFNINAEVILSGPKNLTKVRGAISKGLQGISVPVNVSLDNKATKNLAAFNAGLTTANTNLKALTSNANTAKKSVSGIAGASSKVSTSNNQLAKSATNASKGISKVAKTVKEARSEIEAFGKDSALAIRRFAAFTIATGAIFGFVRAVQTGISEAISFQRELVKITQVTGAAGKQLDGLTRTIDQLSTSLGVNANELLDVARTFAQTGQSLDQVQASLRAVARASLAPTFGSLQQSTEGVIAALNQFNISADKTEEVLGSLNAVSKQFAVESEDLISVIRRAGGVFAASTPEFQKPQEALNDLIAIFTAVRATTRESADSIGTGLRTIFARVQRPQTIEFLKQFNIELTDTEGKFIGFFNAFRELSDKLSALQRRGDTITFGAIVEELGGIRQLKNLIPAIVQFEKAERARAAALAGTGSISKDVALAQQTLAVQIDNLRNRFGKLIRDIAGSQTFQNLAKFAIGAANAFVTLADALRPALPLLTSIAAIKLTGAAFEFTRGFIGGVRKGGGAGGAGGGLGSLITGGGGGGGGAATAASNAQAKQTQGTVSSNTQALQANTTQVSALTKGVGLLQTTVSNQRGAVSNLSQKIVVLTQAIGRIPAGVGAAVPISGPVRRRGSGGSLKRFGGGGRRKRFAGGGLATQGVVGGAILEPPKAIPPANSGVITPARIQQVARKQGRGDRDTSLLGTGKTFNIQRSALSPQTFTAFDAALKDGISAGINLAGGRLAGDLGLPAPNVPRQNTEGFFKSINRGIKGNLFENVLTAFQTNSNFDATVDPGRPFDFENGLRQELVDNFAGLAGIKYVDAKASLRAASPANFVKKIENELAGTLPPATIKANALSKLGFGKSALTAFRTRGDTAQLPAQGIKGTKDLLAKLGFKVKAKSTVGEVRSFFKEKGISIDQAVGGPGVGIPSLLTPQELVFGPDAVRTAGIKNLEIFNKTGDPDVLGRVNLGDISVVPGIGTRDTVRADLAPGSFVVRRSSSVGSGLVDELPKFRMGGAAGKAPRQKFQGGGLAGGGLGRFAQTAAGATLALSVLQGLDFSSFEGFVNGLAGGAIGLSLLTQQFIGGSSGTEELQQAASGAASKLNDLTSATDAELKKKVGDDTTNDPKLRDRRNQRNVANEKLRKTKLVDDAAQDLRTPAAEKFALVDDVRKNLPARRTALTKARNAQANLAKQAEDRLGEVARRQQDIAPNLAASQNASSKARGRLDSARAAGADPSKIAFLEKAFQDSSTQADALAGRVAKLQAVEQNLEKTYFKAAGNVDTLDKALVDLENQLQSTANKVRDADAADDFASKTAAQRKKRTDASTKAFAREEDRRRELRDESPEGKELARREAASQRRRASRSRPRAERIRDARVRLRARGQRQRLGLSPRSAITRGRGGVGGLLGRARGLAGLGGAAASKGLTIPPTGLKALGATLSKGLKPSIVGAVAAIAIGPISDAIGKGLGRAEAGGARGFRGPNAQRNAQAFGGATGALQGAAAGAGVGAFAGPIGALIGGIGGAVIGGITGVFSAANEQAKFDAFDELKNASGKFGRALSDLGTNFDDAKKVTAAAEAADALTNSVLKTTDTLVNLESVSSQVADAFQKFGAATFNPVIFAAGSLIKGFNSLATGLEAEFGIIGNLKAFGDGVAAALGARGAQGRQQFRAAQVSDRRRGTAVAASLDLINEEDLKKAEEAFDGLTTRIIEKLSLDELQSLPDLSDLNIDQIQSQLADADKVSASTDAFGSSLQNLFKSLADANVLSSSKRLQNDIETISGGDKNVEKLFDQFIGSSDDAFRRTLSTPGKGVEDATDAFRDNLVSTLDNKLSGKLSEFNLDTSSLDSLVKSINNLDPKKAKELASGLGISQDQLGQLTQATNTYINSVTDGISELIQAKVQAELIERTFAKLVRGIDSFGQAVDQLSRQVQNAVQDLLVVASNVKSEIDRILSGDVSISPRDRVNPFTDIAGRSNTELDTAISRLENVIAGGVGRNDGFEGLRPLLTFTRDLPFTLKQVADNLRQRPGVTGNDPGAARFTAGDITQEFVRVAGPAFSQLPEVVQKDIRNSLNAIFAGRQDQGGTIGINRIQKILESGAGKELETAVTEFGETLRAGAESLTASLNQLNASVLESANFQLAVFQNRANAEESIVSKRQQFEDRFNKFINRSVDGRSEAERRLRDTLERQVNAGGAAGGIAAAGPGGAAFNALDPAQLINRRGQLEREREGLRGRLTAVQDSPTALEPAGLAEQDNLVKALGENAAALAGNNRALETLRDDVSRLEAVESELARIQESRLNQRQRAQLFASRLGSARGQGERQKIIQEFLKPTIAGIKATQNIPLRLEEAAAILSDPKQVQDAFNLSDAGLDQVQANTTGGIGNAFIRELGGGRFAQTLGRNLFGTGATARGGTGAEEGLITEAERIRVAQEAAIRALANQNTRIISEQQAAFRKELELTAARIQLASIAFEELRERAGVIVRSRAAAAIDKSERGDGAAPPAGRNQQQQQQQQQQPRQSQPTAPQLTAPEQSKLDELQEKAGRGALGVGEEEQRRELIDKQQRARQQRPAGQGQGAGDPSATAADRQRRRAAIQQRIEDIKSGKLDDSSVSSNGRIDPAVAGRDLPIADPTAPLVPGERRRVLGAPTDFRAGAGVGIDGTEILSPFEKRKRDRAQKFQRQKQERAQAFQDRRADAKERFSGLGSVRGQTGQARDFQQLQRLRGRIRAGKAANRLEASIAGRGLSSPTGPDQATRAILEDVRGRGGDAQIGFINRLGAKEESALQRAKDLGRPAGTIRRLEERFQPFEQQRRLAFQELTRTRGGGSGVEPDTNAALRGAAGFDALNRRFAAPPIATPGLGGAPGFGARLPFTGGTTTDRRVVPLNSGEERGAAGFSPRSRGSTGQQQLMTPQDREALNQFQTSQNSFGTNAQKLVDAADKLSNLGSLQIELNTRVAPVEVIINGAQLLAEISPKVEQMVLQRVATKMASQAGGADLGLSSSPLV